MGRKGEGGGTAGGGRSGKKGNITYSRVIPKFLQKLADPEYTRNPLDAKRSWATDHTKERRTRSEATEMLNQPRSDAVDKDDIQRLQAQGFTVVTDANQEIPHHEQDKNGTNLDPDSNRKQPASRGAGNKLQKLGGIEKKSKRTVAKAFDLKNRHKLSFADSDSEGD